MIRVLLQGASMALFLTMGLVRPRDPRCHSCGNEPIRPALRCGACGAQGLITADTLLNVFNGLLLFVVFGLAIRAVKAHTELGLVEVSWLTTSGAQFVFSFLLLDFVRYWVHRADHRISWLWMFHRVHHSSERLDATAGLRMHAVDFLQLSAIPIVLFGVVFDTRGFEPWVIEAAFGVGVVFDAFQHANLHYDLDHPLRRGWHMIFNNPLFHSWHHTRDGSLCDGNYSNTLVIWDRLFGSEVTRPQPPETYGLEADQALKFGVLSMQMLRRRDAAQAS